MTEQEAQSEALRRWPDDPDHDATRIRLGRLAFVEGAAWGREQQSERNDRDLVAGRAVRSALRERDRHSSREAAPSDTDLATAEQATLYGYQAVWDDGKFDVDPEKNAWMWERVQIAVTAAVERFALASQPVQVEVTTVEELDAEFVRADDAGETLTLRDRGGRDWITYGDEWGYRWAWSVPHEDDAFTVPARIDGFEGFERFMPFTVFARPVAALGGGE